jgi:hypothetical protein
MQTRHTSPHKQLEAKTNQTSLEILNYHLFEIQQNVYTDLKRSEFGINEQTGKEDCQTQDRNRRHLPYSMWLSKTKMHSYVHDCTSTLRIWKVCLHSNMYA